MIDKYSLQTMKTYGERLDAALRKSGKDRAQLSRGISVSVQAIGQVIAGKTKALTAENSAKAARFLSVDHYWLATGEGEPVAQSKVTPPPIPGLTAQDWESLPEPDQKEVLTLLAGKIERFKKKSNAA